MNLENTLEFARKLDEEDPLKKFRSKFYIPILHGKESVYLCGNTLGLQPKSTQNLVLNELEDWANFGKDARMHGRKPWVNYHDHFPKRLAPLLGAKMEEVVVMNQLTANLHLMLATFYRPSEGRFKIIYEENAFSSDVYALKSQVELNGYKAEDAMIKIECRKGERTIRQEDILSEIEKCGSSLALVLIGGVNYLTGQVFDMKGISAAAHAVGAKCGFDLAHAVGNIELKLNDWEVDFAVWCSYKYLNSGPGGIGGAFVHEKHIADSSLFRLAGWWGNHKDSRFKMKEDFEPAQTAEGWQLSAPSILSMAVHEAALEIFFQASFKRVLEKSAKLSSWLLFVINDVILNSAKKTAEIITPQEPGQHGSQISLLLKENAAHFSDMLRKNSVLADLQEPDIFRVTAVPLYNTYEDVYLFGQVLKGALSK
ncbi:MAG: kynureninase [Ginsengibacter sp.]